MASVIPSNQAPFDVDEVAAITSGTIVQRGRFTRSVGVSTDSRSIADHNLFVALKGERFDGHEHVANAVKEGARIVVVSRQDDLSVYGKASVVLVNDTLEALGLLGQAHMRRWRKRRNMWATPVVAVAGSAGKTTTRRAITAALRAVGKNVHAPVGNLNNLVGIPMVLLSLEEQHDAVVVEVGTNAPGEVKRGADLVEPTLSVLTLVAREHTEGLGDLDSIAHEEGAIIDALLYMKKQGESVRVVVNGDDPWCASDSMRARAPRDTVWFEYGESERADARILNRQSIGLDGNKLLLSVRSAPTQVSTLEIVTPLLGKAGALATAAAVAVAERYRASELSSHQLSQGFASLRDEHESGRLAPVVLPNGAVLIDDSYNSNRASAEASINTARELATQLNKRLVLVLGEMRELGKFSVEEHRGVGAAAVRVRPDAVLAVNGDANLIHQLASDAKIDSRFVPSAKEAIPVAQELLQGDVLMLFKGSRGVGLDRIVRELSGQGAHP